jgi:hypothetical protein
MPNYCDAIIRVRGRRDCVDEFINVLQSDYYYAWKQGETVEDNKFSHIPHMYRIFEVDIMNRVTANLITFAEIRVQCAWSVFACMFEGPYTYYDDTHTKEFTDKYGPNYGTTVVRESKRLKLDIEIYSSEPGVGFQEHYRIVNGVQVVTDEREVQFIYLADIETYKGFEEWYPNMAKKIDEEHFKILKRDNPEGYTIGGYSNSPYMDDVPFSFRDCYPNYLYLNAMVKRV